MLQEKDSFRGFPERAPLKRTSLRRDPILLERVLFKGSLKGFNKGFYFKGFRTT